jgi:hypothetical protein
LPDRDNLFCDKMKKTVEFIKNIFRPRYVKPKGILLYATVQEVIQAHKTLEKEGFTVRLVAPPPEFRVGCDLAIEFDLIEQEAVEVIIKNTGNPPKRKITCKEMLPDILKRCVITEIDGYLMCKAGNMKITVDKKSHCIVNISGGGCPDIPFVADKMHNLRIEEAPCPIELGNSLCAYLLQIAFLHLKKELAEALNKAKI